MAHYLKRDSEKGFIEDTAFIKYEKFNNLRHSVIGFMMGDFDQEGNYVVSPQIKRELISMPKYIVESMDNIEICRSELKLNKQLSFMVTFEGNRVTLSLLEKINYQANYKLNSGSYSNINEYILDEIVTSGVVNRNAVYERWNIRPFGSHEVDIFNCDETVLEKYFGIVRRFKYLMVANSKLLKKEKDIEEIEAGYANKMFEILKAYPALNKIVLGEIKQAFTEKKNFVCADQPNFAKTLNEIIDVVVEQNLDVLPEAKQEAFKAEQRNLVVETNIKKEDVFDVQEKTQELTKEDVKFNKQHNAEMENTTSVITIPVNATETDKTIEKIAVEFANTQRVVTQEVKEVVTSELVEETLKGQGVQVDDGKEPERERLIDTVREVVGEEIITDSTKKEVEARVTKVVDEKNTGTGLESDAHEKKDNNVVANSNGTGKEGNLVTGATDRVTNSGATNYEVQKGTFEYGYGVDNNTEKRDQEKGDENTNNTGINFSNDWDDDSSDYSGRTGSANNANVSSNTERGPEQVVDVTGDQIGEEPGTDIPLGDEDRKSVSSLRARTFGVQAEVKVENNGAQVAGSDADARVGGGASEIIEIEQANSDVSVVTD